MTVIKDLIEIPNHVRRGDPVPGLAEGATCLEQTLRDHVGPQEIANLYRPTPTRRHECPDVPPSERKSRP